MFIFTSDACGHPECGRPAATKVSLGLEATAGSQFLAPASPTSLSTSQAFGARSKGYGAAVGQQNSRKHSTVEDVSCLCANALVLVQGRAFLSSYCKCVCVRFRDGRFLGFSCEGPKKLQRGKT